MGTRSHTPLVTFARRAGRRVLVAVAALPSTIGWTGAVVSAVLIVAAYLRLKGVSWGLPYNYQDPDEKVVLLHAFRIARGHLNPEFFYYPSMLFTMIGSVTWLVSRFYAPHGVTLISPVTFVTDPTPYYLIGRAVVVACGVTSVYLVYRLGREAFSRPVGLLAALFLAVEPLHVRYSHVAVTDVPATMFGLLALLLFLRASRLRDARTLLCGALAAGLATGTKYNLGMLVVPGVVACWYVYRDQPAAHRASALAARALRRVAAPMLLAFVISTPFAVLDPRHFLGDFYRQNQIVAHGWLGFENVHSGYWYNLSVNLVGSLGVVLLALGLAGLVLALAKRTRADCIIVSFVITYYLYVSSWHELMDRYLLPIVPLLIVLAVRACLALAAVPVVRRRAVVRDRRGGAAAGGDRAARAGLDHLLSLAERHRRAHHRHGVARAASAGQRGDRHGAVWSAARGAPRAALLHRGQPDDADLPDLPAALAPAGRPRPQGAPALPADPQSRLRRAQLRSRQPRAGRARDLPGAGRLLRGAPPPRAAHRDVLAAAGRTGPGDHGLPAAADPHAGRAARRARLKAGAHLIAR